MSPEAVGFIGAYACFPIQKDRRHPEILQEFLALEEDLPFKKIQCGQTLGKITSARFSRDRLPDILKSIASGEVDYLDLIPYWKNADWIKSYATSPTVHWNTSVAESRSWFSPVEERFGLEAGAITIMYPFSRFSVDSESLFQRRLLSLMKQIFVKHSLYYAFVHQGYRPVAPFSIGNDAVFLRTRNGFPLSSFDDIGVTDIFFREFVKGSFWANFLNSKHLEKLGGPQRLVRDRPCRVIEDLNEGRVLLQVGPSPLVRDKAEAAEDYQRLRRFLRPILLETPEDRMKLQQEVMGTWRPPESAQREWKKVLAELRKRSR